MIVQMVKRASQKVTAAQEWKERMVAARHILPDGIGQQDVLEKVVELNPSLDKLTNSTRWRNAWLVKVADPEITVAVETAAASFVEVVITKKKRLSRQKIKKVQ